MKSKPSKKTGDPDEYKRFLATAKEVEADERPEAFDKAFKRVVPTKRVTRKASSRGGS